MKGVAYTFRVINEDADVITKTAADYRLAGKNGISLLIPTDTELRYCKHISTRIFYLNNSLKPTSGPGGVLSLLKFLEKKLVGKTPRNLSRASSVVSVDRER